MRKRRLQRGFTLIELMVVLVIMSLLTLAFLESQSKFDSSTIMRSLAYQVALSIRQAQVYGTSVLQNTQGGGVFGPVYGISLGGSGASYFLFSDPNAAGVGQYDAGVSTIKNFTLSNTYAIAEVCAVTTNGVWRCNGGDDSGGSPGSMTTLNILFRRPNPDATIQVFKANHGTIPGDSYTAAYIELQSITSDTRVIKVTLTGQITVCGVGNVSAGTGVTLTRLKSTAATC